MANFISCDWGTSAFRLRLVDSQLNILAEVRNLQGCAKTNQDWLQKGEDGGRWNYYRSMLYRGVCELAQQSGGEIDHVPVIISGMASSTIGMMEVPYKRVPAVKDGSDIIVKKIKATDDFPHTIGLVSGLMTDDDVMRGEETKLVGCLTNTNVNGERMIVLPGTHPKHTCVNGNQLTEFKTYMTGEFFELLCEKSLLALSVKKSDTLNEEAFADGLKQGVKDNLLHTSFLVRTNALFKKLTAEQNHDYLSGLVIGTELKVLLKYKHSITLLATGRLSTLYAKAFQSLNIPLDEILDADEALLKGQKQILEHRF